MPATADTTDLSLPYIFMGAHQDVVQWHTIAFNMWTCERTTQEGARRETEKYGQIQIRHRTFQNLNAKTAWVNSHNGKIKSSVEAKGTHDTKQDCRFESFPLVAACGNPFFSLSLSLSRFLFVLVRSCFRLRHLMVMQRSSWFFPTSFARLQNFLFCTSVSVFISNFSLCCSCSPASIRRMGKNVQKGFTDCMKEFRFFSLFSLRCSESFLNSEQTTEMAENVDDNDDGDDTMFLLPTTQNQHTFEFEGSAYAELDTNGKRARGFAIAIIWNVEKTNKRHRMHVCDAWAVGNVVPSARRKIYFRTGFFFSRVTKWNKNKNWTQPKISIIKP